MSEHPWAVKAYLLFASLAGSITSLSMMKWQEMTWPERTMTVFAGTSFALFVMPWIATAWLKAPSRDLSMICAVTYIGGTGANVFIPVLIRRFKRLLGEKESV